MLALAGVPDSADSRDWEAVLRAGPGVVLAGPSAARWLGMNPPPSPPCVLVPPGRHLRLPGVTVLHHEFSDADLVALEELFVTCRARTVLDCAFLLPSAAATAFVERALQKQWLSYDELLVRVQQSVGRRDVARVVRMTHALASGARSAAERRLVIGLRRGAVTGWVCNLEVSDCRGLIGLVDIGFRRIKLAIEIDGRAWHVDRDRFQHDRSRQNRLVTAGWTVLRFTWEDVAYRLDAVVDEVRRTVDRLIAG